MNDALNKSLIIGHEGKRLLAYFDTRGYLTIGCGFNLDALGAQGICASAGVNYLAVRKGAAITGAQCDAIFASQYLTTAAEARRVFPAIDGYPENAAAVICDMLFQLGLTRFMGFRHAIAAFGTRNWAQAITEIKDSALATQVPTRVEKNIALLQAIA